MLEICWRVLVSLPKVFWWKLRYAGRCSLPLIQSFGKNTELHIKNDVRKGRAFFGKELVTRGNTVFRVEGGELFVGDKCFFNKNVSITCKRKIMVGDRCQIANNVVIVDHDHAGCEDWASYEETPVTIGSDVWIGAGAIILRGAVIGDRAVIGAGSIVKETVPADTVFYQKRKTIVREQIRQRKE